MNPVYIYTSFEHNHRNEQGALHSAQQTEEYDMPALVPTEKLLFWFQLGSKFAFHTNLLLVEMLQNSLKLGV